MKRRKAMSKPSVHLLRMFLRYDQREMRRARDEPFEIYPCMTMRLKMFSRARGESV